MRPQLEEPEANAVEHIIEWHDGNERGAIRTLLEDVQFLRGQLAMATAAMGKGYTRGWVSSEERDSV
ncbi:dehydrogenase [Agrobacterium rosae]|nr:dehydrogenase [Agrobacterium rosae]MCM2436336.1 dehydrogenase [Agrobacterium rosae]